VGVNEAGGFAATGVLTVLLGLVLPLPPEPFVDSAVGLAGPFLGDLTYDSMAKTVVVDAELVDESVFTTLNLDAIE